MIKIIASILFVQVLAVTGAWSVLLSNEKLNCVGIKIYPIAALQASLDSPCRRISLVASKTDIELSLGNSELIHECLCNLINRPIVWTSLIDQPLEFVMKNILSPKIRGEEADEVTVLRKVDELSLGQSGTLHWTILDTFQKTYNLMLYNEAAIPELKTPIKDPLDMLARSCMRLTKLFENFNQYLNDASLISMNSNLSYKLMKYDSDLFEVFLMNKVCLTLINNTPK